MMTIAQLVLGAFSLYLIIRDHRNARRRLMEAQQEIISAKAALGALAIKASTFMECQCGGRVDPREGPCRIDYVPGSSGNIVLWCAECVHQQAQAISDG